MLFLRVPDCMTLQQYVKKTVSACWDAMFGCRIEGFIKRVKASSAQVLSGFRGLGVWGFAPRARVGVKRFRCYG